MPPASPRISARPSCTPRRTAPLNGEKIDFSLLLDGLQAEREQGITIDIAWRYFETTHRRFVIIDAPGHEQYTRNMATGASHADVAILLVDARHGVKRQTRRHAAICDLVGIKKVVLAVNKMDLIDWSEARFRAIEAEFRALAGKLQLRRRSRPFRWRRCPATMWCAAPPRMPWYGGPTLLDHLETVDPDSEPRDAPFRMPVQLVLRATAISAAMPAPSPRAASGRASASSMRRSGLGATVRRITTMDGDLAFAAKGDAVTLVLDTDLDISRGAVLSEVPRRPINADVIEARLVWLAEAPFDPEAGYLLRTATDLTPGDQHERLGARRFRDLGVDAGACLRRQRHRRLPHPARPRRRARPLLPICRSPAISSWSAPSTAPPSPAASSPGRRPGAASVGDNVFVLDRELLARGLCSDLGNSPADLAEFHRRAQEAAILLRSVGIPVLIEI